MKKLLAMLLALVMVLSFAACGTTEEPVEEPTDAPVEEPTEEPTEEPAEATYTLGLGTVVSQTEFLLGYTPLPFTFLNPFPFNLNIVPD